MARRRMKPFPKFLLIAAVVVGGLFGVKWMADQGYVGGNEGNSVASKPVVSSKPVQTSSGKIDPINVQIVTWPGCAPAALYNGGFAASEQSRYFREQGILVNLVLMDDLFAAMAAWQKGDIDIVAFTADSYPLVVQDLMDFQPRVIFSEDKSRGGDLFVSRREFNSMADLRGRKVAFCSMSPSHSFLLHSLEAAGMTYNDIIPVEAPSAPEAAQMFIGDDSIAAAVVWTPDDLTILENVPGSKVMLSTKDADGVIYDVMYASQPWIDSHQDELKGFLRGWFIGAAEIHTRPAAKQEAVRILANEFQFPEADLAFVMDNFYLCTYGDNLNIFGFGQDYTGVTAQDIYVKTARMYQEIGLISGNVPAWRNVTDTRALRSLNLGSGPGYAAEPSVQFAAASPQKQAEPAVIEKQVSVNFGFDSARLDANAKSIIDSEFGDVAKSFGKFYIRIEGNTDNTGAYSYNVQLSERRAQAVADYLIREYGFDRDRIFIRGNGPDQPVASNDTDAGRARNRRTDFELVRS